MKFFRSLIHALLCLAFFASCTKGGIEKPGEVPEVNPPISPTPIVKEFPGFLGMRSSAAFLTSDNNILICGSDSMPDNFSKGKFRIIKTSKSGGAIWQKDYKIGGASRGSSITELDGHYYATGIAQSTAASPYFALILAKMNVDGDTLWTKLFTVNKDEQFDCKIIKTKDNNLLIAGDAGIPSSGLNHIFAMKVNKDGNTIWSNEYSGGYHETLRNVFESANGDYLITGLYRNNGGDDKTYFVRLNSSGNKLWEKKTDLERYLFTSAELPDGSIVTTGYKQGATYGWTQAYIDKFDASGNIIWQKDYGEDDRIEHGFGIRYNSNNSITIGGTSTKGTSTNVQVGENRYYVINTDMNGNVLWEKRFDAPQGLNYDEMSVIGDKLDNTLLFGFRKVLMQIKPLPARQEDVSTIYYSKVDKDGNFF